MKICVTPSLVDLLILAPQLMNLEVTQPSGVEKQEAKKTANENLFCLPNKEIVDKYLSIT